MDCKDGCRVSAYVVPAFFLQTLVGAPATPAEEESNKYIVVEQLHL